MDAEQSLADVFMGDQELPQGSDKAVLDAALTDLLNEQISADLHKRYTAELVLEKRAQEFRDILTKQMVIDGATLEYLRQMLFEIRTTEKRIESIENGSPVTSEEVQRVHWRLKRQNEISNPSDQAKNEEICSLGLRTTVLNESELQKLCIERDELIWKNKNLKIEINRHLTPD